METNEDLRAKASLGLPTAPKILPISFVKGFGRRTLEHCKHSWNILKQAESYLTWQCRSDYTSRGKEKERNSFLVSELRRVVARVQKASRVDYIPRQPILTVGLWVSENMCILGNQQAEGTLINKFTGGEDFQPRF